MPLAPKAFAIGLTGPLGSGCTTAADLLEKTASFAGVRLSEAIHQEWARLHGTVIAAPFDLQELGNKMRMDAGSSGLLAARAIDRVEARQETIHRIVFDGIRNVGEIETLRDRFGHRFFLLAVEAKKSDRWLRLVAAYLSKSLGETDFDAIDKRDQDEEVWYGQQVQLCVDRSDVLIANEGTVGSLMDKLTQHLRLVTGEEPRYATPAEILMNMAYSASHGSKCLKRQVGAVLVEANPMEMGLVVGTGFNENPPQTHPCVHEPTYGADPAKKVSGSCYRDILRHASFEKFAKEGVRCPKCGDPLSTPTERPPWRCAKCLVHLEDYFWPERAMSWCTAIHAEVSAVLAAGTRARGTTLYTTTFPCFQCVEKIAQAGIQAVVLAAAVNSTIVAGENLTVGSAVGCRLRA